MEDGVILNAVVLQLLLEVPPQPAQASKAAESRKRASNLPGSILSGNIVNIGSFLPLDFSFSYGQLAIAPAKRHYQR